MPRSTLDRFMGMLDEVYEYRDSDPRRARFLRDRLYKSVLEEIAKDTSAISREKIVQYARTALQAEEIDIAPLPRATVR